MNKVIQGLWLKAGMGFNDQQCDPELVEKFARLVVDECLHQIDCNAILGFDAGKTYNDINTLFKVEE